MKLDYPGGLNLESAPLESTGGKIWDASLRTYDFIAGVVGRYAGGTSLNVLELGSGCGWLGLRLAKECSNIRMVLSEQPEYGALAWLEHNLALNPDVPASAVGLNWANIPEEVLSNRWDIIIGCELVYSYTGAELLAQVIHDLLSHPNSVCYYGHSLNRFESVDARFLSEIRRLSLNMEVVDGELTEPGEYIDLFPEMRLVILKFTRAS